MKNRYKEKDSRHLIEIYMKRKRKRKRKKKATISMTQMMYMAYTTAI
jgi:hypothetical protein